MKIVVLTSALNAVASHAVPALVQAGHEIKMVVYNEGQIKNKKKHYQRKLQKLSKIGVGGTITGLLMRRWFSNDVHKYLDPADNLKDYCLKNSIPFASTPTINCDTTVSLIKKANAEVGLSLSNSYIASKIFSICPYGMVNVHGEVLPEYQNAQSIIWQIFNGSSETGFTIHKVESKIDKGAILYQEKFPIIFRDSLSDTVSYNCVRISQKAVKGMVAFFQNFHHHYNNAVAQVEGKHYTTPSFAQFRNIQKQFKILKGQVLADNTCD